MNEDRTLYVIRCQACRWWAECETRPGALVLADLHEPDDERHRPVTIKQVFPFHEPTRGAR